VIFHGLVSDLSASFLALASLPGMREIGCVAIDRLVFVPKSTAADWEFVSALLRGADGVGQGGPDED